MSKNVPGYFSVWPTIQHSSGYRFQQRGGRVFVTLTDGSESHDVDSIGIDDSKGSMSSYDYLLTPFKLQRLAKTWLAENVYNQEEA